MLSSSWRICSILRSATSAHWESSRLLKTQHCKPDWESSTQRGNPGKTQKQYFWKFASNGCQLKPGSILVKVYLDLESSQPLKKLLLKQISWTVQTLRFGGCWLFCAWCVANKGLCKLSLRLVKLTNMGWVIKLFLKRLETFSIASNFIKMPKERSKY